MGGIGQNLQLLSDGSEILCAIEAPDKIYPYQIFGDKIFHILRVMAKNECDIKNLGLYIYIYIYIYYIYVYIYIYILFYISQNT